MPVLTSQQIRAIEVLEWLFDPADASRGSGRSSAMAIALIRIALRNPGQTIDIRDHFSAARRTSRANEALTSAIERMLEDDPLLRGHFLVRAGRLTIHAPGLHPLEMDAATWLPRSWAPARPDPMNQGRNFAAIGGHISNIPPPSSEPQSELTLWDYVQDPTF